ncbi:peptidase M19 [Rhizobium sp. CG5]|uniref:membrane dipeptidase n=1 Tax=Rhizobium sp. CG5 TaxID=2726076 RepID=UPI0020332241|nr:membrane dipeptidase [Rhizobium sp. CG5]MCM2477372.1 peptidase M19 [Rhizobium sp. CG5]
MSRSNLHDRSIVIDGLIVSRWSRELFEAMRTGGLTAANCTCSVWEGFEESMRAVGQWKLWLRENDDLICQIYTVEDIAQAKAQGRVGVILGWQNSDGFGEDVRTVALYAELGLRVVQLTYHNANAVCAGCLETIDRGLTDFGHELVEALNEIGILMDLSHVGPQTSIDAIRASKKPLAYTHCAPKALKDHPRNKTDEELRMVAEVGGMVGVTMFPPFMPRGSLSTLDDYLDVIEYVINLCGEEQVGIGTDFTQDVTPERMAYFLRYKGHGRQLLQPKGAVFPEAFCRIEQYPNLTNAMLGRGWNEGRIARVLGENWLRLFGEVWS